MGKTETPAEEAGENLAPFWDIKSERRVFPVLRFDLPDLDPNPRDTPWAWVEPPPEEEV